MNNELWKELLKANIEEAEIIFRIAKNNPDLFNSQEFLDWQDQLNDISCR